MSTVDDCRCDEENLLFSREELALDIAAILRGDAHSADALAQMFVVLREAVEGGLEGIKRTSATLAAAAELTFAHSPAHEAALRLYMLSREGRLRVEDEPVRLLSAAIERSTAGSRAGFDNSAQSAKR
jgi:hypothetical protein